MLKEILLLFAMAYILLPTNSKTKVKSRDKIGKQTYEHFQKAQTDEDMKKFLKANYQDPEEFKGLSRSTICERMMWKAEQNGQEYTHWPY